MAIYIVHTTKDGARAKFTTFQKAFAYFKNACKDRWTDTALWYGSDLASWTRVYCTEHYPDGLKQPWCKPRPHSFFQSEA